MKYARECALHSDVRRLENKIDAKCNTAHEELHPHRTTTILMRFEQQKLLCIKGSGVLCFEAVLVWIFTQTKDLYNLSIAA
jgi:hypothetical protein